MKYTLYTLFLIYLGCCHAQATLTGVIYTPTGEPAPFMIVQIDSSKQFESTTNESGVYKIENLSLGEHQVKIIGWSSHSSVYSIMINQEGHRSIDFKIKDNEAIALQEVVIETQSDTEIVKSSGYAVESIAVEQYQNSTRNVSQVLNNSSGVRIRRAGGLGSDFTFSLNGLSGYRVRFFVDDIPMEYLGDAYQINNLPINLVDRIDVYKGVVPVDLGGDALGGAVNIITTQSSKSHADASFSYGSFNTQHLAINTQYRDQKSGFTVRPKFFYNFSNNNYTMRDMKIYVDRKWDTLNVERFHDDYFSVAGTIETGFTFTDWADELLIGVSASQIKQDIQTDFAGNPKGETVSEEQSQIYSLKYKKSGLLNEKIDVSTFGVYSTINHLSVDTSSHRYDWRGEITRTVNGASGEFYNSKTLFEFDQKTFIYRTKLTYHLSANHKITTNYLGYQVSRQGENRLGVAEEEPFSNPNKLGKNIVGLSYDGEFLKDNLLLSGAVKYYNLNINTARAVTEKDYSIVVQSLESSENKLGYYLALRHKITSEFSVKASYEKGYRLPEPQEVFGDGLSIFASPELQPETSNNFNIGLNYIKSFKKSKLKVESNAFSRDVEDYVFRIPYNRGSKYTNLFSVLIYGYEFGAQYITKSGFAFSGNFTRQYVLNNEEFVNDSDRENRVYRDHLPNTPYLFWNIESTYNIFKKHKKLDLTLNYSINYVYEFFLGYESIANAGEKNIIPTQSMHNLGVTIGSKNKRYNLSLECTNIYNELAFDNFNIQKAGRAYFAKVRYLIKK